MPSADWKEFRIRRKFRGAEYDIHISNPDGVCKGIRSLTVDGVPVQGNVVPATPGKHMVEARL